MILSFGKYEGNNLGYLRCILLFLETVSGIKLNISKSVLIRVGEVLELHHPA